MFNMDYKFSADYDWCIQCLQHSRKNIYVNAVVADFLDEGTTSRNHKASLKERYKIMCYYFGVLPTTLRHISFFFRNLKRKYN